MDCYKKLAISIKQNRVLKNWSQEQFAEMLDVSATHVKHLESGHRKPSVEMLFKICKLTGMSLDKILYAEPASDDSEVDAEIINLLSHCSRKDKKLIKSLIEAVISER